MKKILVIHNKYRLTGGEDIAVSNEIALLKQKFEVKVLFFDNTIKNYLKQIFWFCIIKIFLNYGLAVYYFVFKCFLQNLLIKKSIKNVVK